MPTPKYQGTARNSSELLTTKEAAAIAKVSVRRVQAWVKMGRLHAVQRHPKTLISRTDLERFLHSRKLPAKASSSDKDRSGQESTTLTISDAARLCGVARTTLQRAVRAGRLHLDDDRRIKREELIRTGYLRSHTEATGNSGQKAGAMPCVQIKTEEPSHQVDEGMSIRLDLLASYLANVLAQQQTLSDTVNQIQQHVEQLRSRQASTGQASQEILAVMKSNPKPLHVREIQQYLGWKHSPRHTLRHMTNIGLLRRISRGVYALPLEDDPYTAP